MLNLRNTLLALAAVLLGACGGGGDNTIVGQGGSGLGPAVDIGSLTLITSQPQILSDGSNSATLTAIVRDANNNTVEGVSVVFSASSGSLTVSSPAITSASGSVTAELSTPSNFRNRTITVTATADDFSDTVTVDVTGTSLLINGPNSLPLGDVGNYNVVLTDAGGTGIAGQSVDVTSSTGNAVSASPLTTDVTGQASFMLTANASGADMLTATGLGLTATQTVNVSSDQFAFTTPAPATEIPLNTPQTFTVQWLVGGSPVTDGSQISFSSTRGTVSASTATTTGGTASITVTATNAGPAVVTATNSDGTSTQRVVEFVATTPAEIDLQASPFTVGPQEQSALTAIVRDAAGNLVKNQVVTFTLDDVTGGSLSVAQGVTNSQGRVQTFYTASTQTSAANGVIVTAAVQGTALSNTVNLTVAERELFISLGTGNSIEEPNVAQYRVEYVVQVTDAQGNGVSGVTVQFSLLSRNYNKGFRTWNGATWATTINAICADEDLNNNGILDTSPVDEDTNGNGLLEAGNIAAVSVQGVGGGTLTTDSNGFGFIDIFYPQEYAYYLEVELKATASVAGTETVEPTIFTLTGAAADFNSQDIAPPGVVSPFGVSNSCLDTN
ncbi:MAG: Ig-like domain-containing protein [Gammaproteobacteria bacterium]|jgi:hypothetical protein